LSFKRDTEGTNKKLPTRNDEESSLVDKRFEISNYELIKDMKKNLRLGDALIEKYDKNI